MVARNGAMKYGPNRLLAGFLGFVLTLATAHAQDAKDQKDPKDRAADVKVAETFPGRLEQYFKLVESADALRPNPSEEWYSKGRFATAKVRKALTKDLSKLKGKTLYEKLLAFYRGEVPGIEDEAQWGALCYLTSIDEPAAVPFAVEGLLEDEGMSLFAIKAVAERIEGEPLKAMVKVLDSSPEEASLAQMVLSELPTMERIKTASAFEDQLKSSDAKAGLKYSLAQAAVLMERKARAKKERASR